MACNYSSGNFSSSFPTCNLPSSGCSFCSSYPSDRVYNSASCSPSTCLQDSFLHSGCQETYTEPSSCQKSCVVSSPWETYCYYPRISTPCNTCQLNYDGNLGFGGRSFPSSRSYQYSRHYSVLCGSSAFRHLNYGVSAFPSLKYRTRFCYPTYLAYSTCQPSYFLAPYDSGFCVIN